MRVSALIAFSLGAAVQAAATPVRRACSSVLLIHAAGTGETGLGIVGTPLASALQSLLPGSTAQALSYSTSAEYVVTVAAGAQTLDALIASQVAACPQQKIALSGYSKGAMVAHAARLSATVEANVCGITVFGDPTGGNVFPISSISDVKAFCNSGDPFCDGGFNIFAHLAYATDGSAEEAAQFLAGVCG